MRIFSLLISKPWFLALAGGILMCLAWEIDLWPVLFVAWIPWLHLMHILVIHRTNFGKSYGILYLAVLTWNALTVWWIQGASFGAMLGAVFAMAACMALVLTLVELGWKHLGNYWGNAALVAGWIGFEYFFHNSEIAWPWLTLGNGFAAAPWVIQWYEYTGILGGSLWVLLFNILLYTFLTRRSNWHTSKRLIYIASLGIVLLSPIILSVLMRPSDASLSKNKGIEVVIVQPNIDPWTEKFSTLSDEVQVQRMLSLAEETMTPNTRLVVMPETSIPSNIWLHELDEDTTIALIRNFLSQHPQCKILVGTTLLQFFNNKNELPPTARPIFDGWYTAYNSALWIDHKEKIDHYFKSKLVVGVEMTPYPQLFRFLDKISINLGGMVGNLGTQPERAVFWTPDSVGIAPIVCYESAFGEFCTDYVRNGAQILAVITNDGWWGDTPGYKNHFNFSKLRAIETRRWLVRSANTGISGIITPRGEVTEQLGWWLKGTLRGTVYPQTGITFYVRWGDYLGRIAYFCCLVLVVGGGIVKIRRKL